MQNAESTVAVIMPGTGSDAAFVREAFTAPLARVGVTLIAPEPDPHRVVASYLDALDAAAEQHGQIVLGGVSLGAAVAVNWARTRPEATIAVLAALPPWTGAAEQAPAALSARYTADALRTDGLAEVTARMQASSPPWLARTLTRSWATHGDGLADALEEAAAYIAPTTSELRDVTAPVAIAAAGDDAVHPAAVAEEWATALPRVHVQTLSLSDLATHPSALGHACVDAWVAVGSA
ncbi:MAG: alpha/beta hydrolase [Rhodococcus sp.]|nr:alpha/beta hydrolase [Rhodococcus sp. (in: high G+C Gram-positive bacteria)]